MKKTIILAMFAALCTLTAGCGDDFKTVLNDKYYEDDTPSREPDITEQTLTLGSGAFIPGFEDQLVGSRPGDEVRVHVTFPAQYHAPELAGKDAEFVCKVHEIRESGEYGSQDEFAKAVGCGRQQPYDSHHGNSGPEESGPEDDGD